MICEVLKLKFPELRMKNIVIFGYIEKEKKKKDHSFTTTTTDNNNNKIMKPTFALEIITKNK